MAFDAMLLTLSKLRLVQMNSTPFIDNAPEEKVIGALSMLGLSRNESIIYVALQKNGPSLIGALSSATGMHRQVLYQGLENLVAFELISVEEGPQGRIFTPSSLECLNQLIEPEGRSVKKLLPKLEKIHLASPSGLQVRVLHGRPGLVESLYDAVASADAASDKTMRIISGARVRAFWDAIGDLKENYLRMCESKGIHKLLISQEDYPADLRKRIFVPRSGNKFRHLEKGLTSPGSTRITESLVCIELYEPQPLVIQIHSRTVASAYTATFNAFWKAASA